MGYCSDSAGNQAIGIFKRLLTDPIENLIYSPNRRHLPEWRFFMGQHITAPSLLFSVLPDRSCISRSFIAQMVDRQYGHNGWR